MGLEHRTLVMNGRSSYDPYLEYLSLSSQLPPQALTQPGAPHLDGSSLPPTTVRSAQAMTPHDDNISMASSGATGIAGGVIQGAELLTVTIVKGAEGFGFTIADSSTGQCVKQVGCYSRATLVWCYFFGVLLSLLSVCCKCSLVYSIDLSVRPSVLSSVCLSVCHHSYFSILILDYVLCCTGVGAGCTGRSGSE